MPEAPTKASRTKADLAALFKARHSLVWLSTREERRAENMLIESAAAGGYQIRLWDCVTGVTLPDGSTDDSGTADPVGILGRIRDDRTRTVWILRDLPAWFQPMPILIRWLKTLGRELVNSLPTEARTIVLLQVSADIPPDLRGVATALDLPLPERSDIASVLDEVLSSVSEKAAGLTNGARDAVIDSAVGMSVDEAANTFATSLVKLGRIDPATVAGEKRRIISASGVLTWYDPDPRGLAAVGGLQNLKDWLSRRRSALTQKARLFGLPAPRGVLLVGVPGCGKSLCAKAVSAAWGVPLLRIDLGGLRSKYVGESEANLRKALSVAESVSPCVLWVDEIEKALGGSTGPQGDGGVAADALGALLNWLQERTGSVFCIATANNVQSLPPELLRKGRWDDLFFVDLPTLAERVEILKASLAAHGRTPDGIDLSAVAGACNGFSGAEIAATIPDALFVAFDDSERALNTDDLISAVSAVVPMSVSAGDKITQLRDWARGRCRMASPQETTARTVGRAIQV